MTLKSSVARARVVRGDLAPSVQVATLPASRTLELGDAPGTTAPGFPAESPPQTTTIGDALSRFGLVTLGQISALSPEEKIGAALGNLDALTAVALLRGRRWQRKDGTQVITPEPDVKGALQAQRAGHELLRLVAASEDDPDAVRVPRDLQSLLAAAREVTRAVVGVDGPSEE